MVEKLRVHDKTIEDNLDLRTKLRAVELERDQLNSRVGKVSRIFANRLPPLLLN